MTFATLVQFAAVGVVVVALWQYRGPVQSTVAVTTPTSGDAHRTRHLTPDGSPRYTNRLARERSPYLRQHAHNPVDWYPWGPEALERARTEKKPILLSIGYSTCHWCHVMERESFEDEEIAAYLNEHFVAIKVDREERPDLDAVYMGAVHAMGQSGGWPLTMWLTPDGRPFYGGTYFPPRTQGRRLGFLDLLQRLRGAWSLQNEEATAAAADLTQRLAQSMAAPAATALPGPLAIRQAQVYLQSDFDAENGGFGDAPKFPRTPMIEVLLRHHRRTGDAESLAMAERTLDALATGGIHDQLGGGFHRYTVDDAWRVPHFEKMLPDQALIAVAFLEGRQATGRADFGAVARRTLDYVARELEDPNGGFHAAVDADSDGGEGRFYTWTPDELAAVLDPESAQLAAAYFAVTPEGNLEGRSVLATPQPLAVVAERLSLDPTQAAARLEDARARLYAARAKRTAPHVDTKVVTAWNGLMVSALARGAQALREPRYADAASRAADTMLAARTPDGRLVRSTVGGVASGPAFLEDYAFLIAGLLDLYEATGDPRRLEQALALQATLDAHFWDDAAGGYFRTADDAETLLVREKPDYDGAEPSGNSVAVQNLLRLWELTTDDRWRERGEGVLQAFGTRLGGDPQALLRMVSALDFLLDRPKEIVIVTPPGDDAKPLLDRLHATFVPNRVLIVVPEGDAQDALAKIVPLVAEKTVRDGRATAYVCEQRVCQLPTTDPAQLATELARVAPLS